MEVPTGYNDGNGKYVLKLKTNMYRLSDISLTQYKHCTKGLIDRGFKLSTIDLCLFYKDGLVIILYINNVCIFGISKQYVEKFIEILKRLDKKSKQKYPYQDGRFDFIIKSSIIKFLGVEVYK